MRDEIKEDELENLNFEARLEQEETDVATSALRGTCIHSTFERPHVDPMEFVRKSDKTIKSSKRAASLFNNNYNSEASAFH